MPYCNHCGAEVQAGEAFCAKCGQPLSATSPPSSNPPLISQQSTLAGLSENVASTLCYVLGWISGIFFLLMDKRPLVRFHAAQSIVVFGALHLVNIVIGMVFGVSFFFGGFQGFSFGILILHLLNLLTLGLWILLMLRAYQGDLFRIPVAADLADKIAKP